MISENIHDDLIKSLIRSFSEISSIMKAIGNKKRIQVMIFLLNGPQSFGTIVNQLGLKKTAVSNHLSQLIKVNLIKKEGNGIYDITGDGVEFIKAIEHAYQKSPTRQIKKFEFLQRRGISTSFLNRFNK